ncbi:hypothetical protein PoB_007081100 [Plakobranchus ocellatus]|uniref:Uncharacterized protein n=1 Tax=Plakobranchus ocellatus TaxID=259542 RepID=A0AAV4DK20_9GAST|nr:hypothetical protein PoB_007081100 [Plakobranchus ocellatus]
MVTDLENDRTFAPGSLSVMFARLSGQAVAVTALRREQRWLRNLLQEAQIKQVGVANTSMTATRSRQKDNLTPRRPLMRHKCWLLPEVNFVIQARPNKVPAAYSLPTPRAGSQAPRLSNLDLSYGLGLSCPMIRD